MDTKFDRQQPISSEKARISFKMFQNTLLKNIATKYTIGEIYNQSISINNLEAESTGMAVAGISYSACVDIDMNQLEKFREDGDIDHFEIDYDN
jgi:hypothetical protein